MQLLRINDQAENDWIAAERKVVYGERKTLWIAASDRATEDTWVWEDSTEFWQGRADGMPIDDEFSLWTAGEPDNNDNRSGLWTSAKCGKSDREFVCERPPHSS
jgi:hypothetical protein